MTCLKLSPKNFGGGFSADRCNVCIICCSTADAAVEPYVVIISLIAFVAIVLVAVFIIVCVRCPHFCVVDVVTYNHERRQLRRRLRQHQGKPLDLMHYLQQRKLQLESHDRQMNTMALYVAVSEEMRAIR